MGFKAEGSSKTYKKSHMCGPPASTNGFTDPGYIHDVLLTDLSPSSQYFYSYGSSKVSGYWVKLIERSSLQTSLSTGHSRGKWCMSYNQGVQTTPSIKKPSLLLCSHKTNDTRFTNKCCTVYRVLLNFEVCHQHVAFKWLFKRMDLESIFRSTSCLTIKFPWLARPFPLGLNIDRYITATTLAAQSDNNISSSPIRANRT